MNDSIDSNESNSFTICNVSNSKEMNEKIRLRINKELDDEVHVDDNGNVLSLVCAICNRFLFRSEVGYIHVDVLKRNKNLLISDRVLPNDVKNYYKCSGLNDFDLAGALFLPRSIFITKGRNRNKVVSCNGCRNLLKSEQTPEFAISNSFEVGTAPDVIKKLTDVEAAFVADNSYYIHYFTYSGGHKGIKGSHVLIKTNAVRKRRALACVDKLENVTNRIFISFTGNMTKEQKKKISKYCTIRRDVCAAAADWLFKNNIHYKELGCKLNLNDLPDPIILEDCNEVPSSNNHVELSEEMTVFFLMVTLMELLVVLGIIQSSKNLQTRSYLRIHQLKQSWKFHLTSIQKTSWETIL